MYAGRTIGRCAVIALAVVWSASMLSYAIMREMPVGSIRGRVLGTETGRPISDAVVTIMRESSAGSEDWAITSAKSDRDGFFHFEEIPVGTYIIEANAKVHSLAPSKIEVSEGRAETVHLELDPTDQYLRLYIHQRMWMSQEKPIIVLDGFTESDEVLLDIYRLNLDRLIESGAEAARQMLAGEITGEDFSESIIVESREQHRLVISRRDSEGVYHEKFELAPHPRGIYVVRAAAGDQEAIGSFSVGDIALVTKETGPTLLAYVTRPDTGGPVAGARIMVLEGSRMMEVGETGRDGLMVRQLESPPGGHETRIILARRGDSVAYLASYAFEPEPGRSSIYAYTDRPVYRPGQRVYYKGIVREFAKDAYRTPLEGTAGILVADRRGTIVHTAKLPLSPFGTFHGSFLLPQYAPTGQYEVNCSYNGCKETTFFAVAEYRKPEFSVSVEMPKKRCARGEIIKARIRATYYFGAPVAGAEVRYSVTRSDYWFWSEEEYGDYYEADYQDYGAYGETVLEGSARTGEDGTAEIRFLAVWKQPEEAYEAYDQKFTISAHVTDLSRREAEAEASIIATQGDFDLAVTPKSYLLNIGQTARFRIIASRFDHRPRQNATVEASAFRLQWESGKEKRILVKKANLRTDAKGGAAFVFTPKDPGNYVIPCSSRDDRGNLIRALTWIWVPSEEEFAGYSYPSLEVILDKKTYDPGETAKVLINSRAKGATALVTVEGRRLFSHNLVQLKNKSTVIEIPIRQEFRPNFYVNVCYVRDKQFITQEEGAKVSLREQTLRLVVTPNKKRYEPGEKAVYLIKTSDSKGQPVSAEVSLGVVDEAIYDIREDDTRPIRDFFYSHQWNMVRTNYSFPEIYFSGDKAGYTGKVRKEFVDTAFWRADVVTDASGKAQISFIMPDNLTTWRATARGCTRETAVGETTSTVITSKDLLVRLETPRFLVQNDQAIISAIVHNYLPRRQEVTVGFSARGVKVEGRLSRSISIDRGRIGKIEWKIQAEKPGDVTLMAFATCPAAKDAMEIKLPVHPNGQRLVENRTGALSGSTATEKLFVRSDVVPGASEIRIRLAPSIASAMLGSLEYLAEYPYGCTEQTMSAFLPDLAIWQTLKSLKIRNAELENELPRMVAMGLNRLYDSQHETGGWGWCEYGGDDIWMTAYVLYGLLSARKAGFEVDEDVMTEGINFLRAKLKSPDIERSVRASGTSSRIPNDLLPRKVIFAYYVLSLAGLSDFVDNFYAQTIEKWEHPAPFLQEPANLALTVLTLANIGQREKAREYASKLWKHAVITRAGAYWPDEAGRYGGSSTETSAYAVMAALRVTPDDPRIDQAIRWILGERRFNHWNSTKDTAAILYALSDYLSRTGELKPQFRVTLLHNGRVLAALDFDSSSVFAPEKEIIIHSGDIAIGPNQIHLEKSGRGRLYYSVELIQSVSRKSVPKTITASGIRIAREYRKLLLRRNEKSGLVRLEPSRWAVTEIRTGEVLRVRLIVHSPREYRYVLIEDYLPAGCEAFDRGRMEPWEWAYWWADRDVRDERVSFYVERLPAGQSVLEYEMRAGVPGTYTAMPALVQAMYEPSIVAIGREAGVRIR